MGLIPRRPAPGSFRARIVLTTALITAAGMLLLTVVMQLVLADMARSDVDAVLEERVDAVVSSVDAATTGGRLVLPSAALDPGALVYAADGSLVGGTVAPRLHDVTGDLATTAEPRTVDVGESERILAEPFTTSGGASGVVVVVEPLAAHEAAEHYALIVNLVTGALATVIAAAIAAWVTGRALQPVSEMASTATDWSRHDLQRRFDLGPPTDEITGLAATLDELLDKVAAALRSEQQLTSELAHELRTPLTTIQATADLALMRADLPATTREDLAHIAAETRRMAAGITALLQAARTEVGALASGRCHLPAVVAEVVAGVDHVSVDVADVWVAAPHATAVRALSPVVSNAARHAATQVRILAHDPASGLVTVTVEDDGVGVDDPGEWIFEPGTTSGAGSGAGLGLSIGRRMARSVGGDVVLVRASGPTRFEVRLPRG